MSNEFINLINEIEEYLDNDDHNFHNRLFIIYCYKCEMITKAGGDYRIFAGRDCGGDSYKTVFQDECCLSCKGNHYEKIMPLNDNNGFEKLTPQQIIKAINKSIDNLFNFPSLYNINLPAAINSWKKLSIRAKIKQIKDVMKQCEKIKVARKHLEELENSI